VRRTTRAGLFGAALLAAGMLGAAACGPAGFDPVGKLESVRVLAAQASEPYAKPGDTVTVTLDAFDARPAGGQAMKIYWLPILCENPYNDLYYACFSSLVAPSGDGGVSAGDGGGGSAFPANIDITSLLEQGPKHTFTMPADVIATHPVVQGLPEQYGLVILFAMACAGRVRTLPIDPTSGNGQTVPLGCFDDQGNQLGPDDYVFTFMRVYAYANATNANPQIDGVVFDGQPVDLNQGVVVDRCPSANPAGTDCQHPFNVNVPDSSWELASGAPLEPDGTELHEQIWANYYFTLDQTDSDVKLLFDGRTGRVTGNDVNYIPPDTPGQGRLFVVVHDNRGGASWVDFPVYVK
jgi:hypothetical protein